MKAMSDNILECLCDWIALWQYTGFFRGSGRNHVKKSYKNVYDNNHEAQAIIANDLLFWSQGSPHWQICVWPALPLLGNCKVLVRKEWRNGKWSSSGMTTTPLGAQCRQSGNYTYCLNIIKHESVRKYCDYKHIPSSSQTRQKPNVTFAASMPPSQASKTWISLIEFRLHSLWITACNKLDCLGIKETFINQWLHLKSMTFTVNLQNTIYTAWQYNHFKIHTSLDHHPLWFTIVNLSFISICSYLIPMWNLIAHYLQYFPYHQRDGHKPYLGFHGEPCTLTTPHWHSVSGNDDTHHTLTSLPNTTHLTLALRFASTFAPTFCT